MATELTDNYDPDDLFLGSPMGYRVKADTALFDDQDLNKPKVTGTFYAWGRLTGTIFEEFYEQAFRNTYGTFTFVDLCSALPYWPQMLREKDRRFRYKQAVQLVSAGITSRDGWIPTLDSLDDDTYDKVSSMLTSIDFNSGRLLIGEVHRLLYDPPTLGSSSSDWEKESVLYQSLMYRFTSSVVTSKHYLILDDKSFVLRLYPQQLIDMNPLLVKTLETELKELVGDDLTPKLMQEIAIYFTRRCLPLTRKSIIASLDIADPQQLFEGGRDSFPEELRSRNLYREAKWARSLHMQASILSLPLRPNSISGMTSVEGYPWFFTNLPPEEHTKFARDIADSLKPGGFAGFFPFEIYQGSEQDKKGLAMFISTLEASGLNLLIFRHPKLDLFNIMGDRERALVYHSQIFTESASDSLSVLIAQKPK